MSVPFANPAHVPLASSLFFFLHHKVKYKEDSKKEMSVNLFSLLPDTIDAEHAKEQTEMQSEVGSGRRDRWIFNVQSISCSGSSHRLHSI